jgi:hypothetical protein
MWAKILDVNIGIYKLDSIPFYGASIATDDEFFAEFDNDEQFLTYRKTIKFSGNSIILILIKKEGFDKEIIRDEFKGLNCNSEDLNNTYFSMEVLESTDYGMIQDRLKELEIDGIIEYSEPCISEKHQSEKQK